MLLFIIFVNYLHNEIACPQQFAQDTEPSAAADTTEGRVATQRGLRSGSPSLEEPKRGIHPMAGMGPGGCEVRSSPPTL